MLHVVWQHQGPGFRDMPFMLITEEGAWGRVPMGLWDNGGMPFILISEEAAWGGVHMWLCDNGGMWGIEPGSC